MDVTGSSALPLMRVKKIINADEDVAHCSANAAFAITFATEMFIRYFVEQVHNVVKAERKPRRNIQYKDVANTVARIDNLEFLSDVVPRTILYKTLKEREKKAQRETETETQEGETDEQREGELGDGTEVDDNERMQDLPDAETESAVVGEPQELAFRQAVSQRDEEDLDRVGVEPGIEAESNISEPRPTEEHSNNEMDET